MVEDDGREARAADGSVPGDVREQMRRAVLEQVATLVSLGDLADRDGEGLSDQQVLDVIESWSAVQAHAAAQLRAWCAALASRASTSPEALGARGQVAMPSVAGDEIGMRLGVSRWEGARLIADGLAFRGVLGEVGEALAAGSIDAGKAREFVEALAEQEPPVALAVCEEVLPQAPVLTARQVASAIQRAIVRVDPDGAADRHARAAARRRLGRPRAMADGMARLTAILTAAQAAGVYAACEAAARAARAHGDSRTLDQLRADAMAAMGAQAVVEGRIGPGLTTSSSGDRDVDLARGGAVGTPHDPARPDGASPRDGTPEVRHADDPSEPAADEGGSAVPRADAFRFSGPASRLHLEIPLDVLTAEPQPGAALDAASGSVLPEAAELVGYGALDPATARMLAAQPELRTVVLDPGEEERRRASAVPHSSTPWDAGRERHDPPEALARFVRLRDPTCVAPGCDVPSSSCDLDHVIEYPIGPTDAWNLRPLCRRDHLLKTHCGYTLTVEPDGATVWATPFGQVFRRSVDGRWGSRGRASTRDGPATTDSENGGVAA